MKRSIFYAASLLFAASLVSCSNEESENFVQDSFTVEAGIGIHSRTELAADNSTVVWSEGDQIYLFGGSSNATMTLISGAGETTATFGGPVNGFPSQLTKALYPVPNVNGDSYTYEFPSEITYSPNSSAPMLGGLNGGNVTFSNLTPLVRVPLVGLEQGLENTLTLTMDGITGTATVNLETGELEFSNNGTSNQVTVTIPAGTTTCFVDIPVPTGTYDGYEIKLNNEVIASNSTTCDLDVDNSVTVTPGTFSENEGEEGEQGVEVVDGTYILKSVGDLVWLANQVNSGINFDDVTVKLGANINLSGINWTSIGTEQNPFSGIFDGDGKTIKNLNIVETEAKEGKAFIGLFGYAEDAEIKNVTFENANVNIACLDIDHSQGHIAVVAGSLEGTSSIENVTVQGDIKVESTVTANGASRVAVVAGGNSYGNVTMKNVHVNANVGSYLKANNNVGALAGQLQGKSVFENCSSNIDVTGTKFFAGGIIGLAAGDQTFTNCHTTGKVAITAGRAGRAHDHYRVGGIAGGWADGANKVCTLTNCSYIGTLSGTNSDGSVAETFDYAGYVGRGYTLNNCKGSKVIIDGVEYIQAFNTAAEAGVYIIDGVFPVFNADQLVEALANSELKGVKFMNDIKIDPANMSNAYGTTGINIKNGQSIDGNGFTLNINGAGGTWDSGINTTGGLIKDLTVTGSFRGIFINHNSTHSEKVVLENVIIGGNGIVYTISCDQGLYQTLEATGCTFNGWTSFAATLGEAKFVNCSFGEGNGYKYCRPYSNTEFKNCTFCPGYNVDTTRAEVTFTDCTFE